MDTYKIDNTYKLINPYKCGFCGRGYQRKIYYSRHVAICELMCKSTKERRLENQECDDTPSLRNLYDVILEMAIKMSAMEQKMTETSKWVDSKKRKINIIDWLNKSHNNGVSTIEDLIMKVKVERRHLEYLFKEDYTGTITFILQELLPSEQDSNPIKAFEHKPNTLFAYVKEHSDSSSINKWIIMPDELFQQMINVITKQLLDEFIVWQKENTHKMDQDDFAIKYANNARKIMGGSLTREQIYSRVKLDLYKYLKRGHSLITHELLYDDLV